MLSYFRLWTLLLLLCVPLKTFAIEGKSAGEFELRSKAGRLAMWLPSLLSLTVAPFAPLLTPAAFTASLLTAGIKVSTIVAKADMRRLITKLREQLANRPDIARIEEVGDEFNVYYRDGWSYSVTWDFTVVEIRIKEVPPEVWEGSIKARAQKDIFDIAATVGLTAPEGKDALGGAAHFNLDIPTAFEGDALLFRNFLVDFMNHSEIATGLMMNDAINATALRWSKRARARFVKLIESFDRGEITSIEELAKGYAELVLGGWIKHDALVVRDIGVDGRFRAELRAMGAPATAAEFSLQMRLILGRIRWLKQVNRPIPFLDSAPTRNPYEQVESLDEYARSADMSFEEIKPLVAKRFRKYSIGADGEVVRPSKLAQIGACLVSWLETPISGIGSSVVDRIIR